MRRTLPKLDIPIYSCVEDTRVPGIVLYPLDKVIKETGCSYFNNSIAYAIAFALYKKVGSINIFGADFTYKTNVHFGEMGRACCEFWLSKCITKGIDVAVAPSSSLLDTNVPIQEKLYGYHRLEDPPVVYINKGKLTIGKTSEVVEDAPLIGVSGRKDIGPPEPEKY
tara:strand:- start:252 stop:752 length:501 start_codon:yes stop_codon:yes gene_type:complete